MTRLIAVLAPLALTWHRIRHFAWLKLANISQVFIPGEKPPARWYLITSCWPADLDSEMILWYDLSIQCDRVPPVIWYALWLLPTLIGRTSNFTCKVSCKSVILSPASYYRGQQPPSSNAGYINMLLRHRADVNQSWAIYGPKRDVAVWLAASKSVREVWLSSGKRRVCRQTSTCLIVRQPTTGKYAHVDCLVSCSEARPR